VITVDLSISISENFSHFFITSFKCVFFCSRTIISGLIGNSTDSISSRFMMVITNYYLVSGMIIALSCSTAHMACDNTKPSSVSEIFSSSSFSSLDSASATMLFFPVMWTYFGPYYSRSNLLVILSFDSLPYNMFKWSLCAITC
jgi:hypothetical protein